MLSVKVESLNEKPQEDLMEEVHHEKVLDYLQSLQGLGPEEFLATYSHPFLLENYLAPSSRTKLGRVETISEVDVEDLLLPTGTSEDEALLQARAIPLEKRDKDSADRMIFVGRAANNDILVLNKMVSKLHAYFCQVPGSGIIQLVDMNSTNGTFINGDRVSPSVKTNLDDGDIISFGPETELEFFSASGFCKLLQQLI
jgi:hypothetical protein